MVETNRRIEAYRAEIQVFSQLKMSFQEWRELTPSWVDVQPEEADLMFVIPRQPIEVAP